jgi:hypothetical protein
MRFLSLLLVLVLPLAGCGGDAATASADGTWVGDVSTDGNVTTVRNEAGSKWGGAATLVEEGSIGVETGAPEYMLGSIAGLWIDDEEIYLIDTQVPIVRVYDLDGRHLRDIGAEGQGPGEYERPRSVLVGPDGRVYVSDAGGDRINVYSHDGESLETWRWSSDGATRMSGALTMRHDGDLFTSAYIMPSREQMMAGGRIEMTSGAQKVGPEGADGEFLEMPDLGVERIEIQIDERRTRIVSYSPGQISAYSPSGAWIVGDNSDYSFQIHYPDGRQVNAHRFWDPVPVESDHAEYLRRRAVASARRSVPEFNWGGAEIPEHKTAYYAFYPTQGNQVLVVREGPSHRVEGCDVNFDMSTYPSELCYEPERIWDMFDLEGNYLGEVIRPQYPRLFTPFFRDDVVLLVVEDELGTVMVKRFRFELPEAAVD